MFGLKLNNKKKLIYPNNPSISGACPFCNCHLETKEHFFIDCEDLIPKVTELKTIIYQKLTEDFQLKSKTQLDWFSVAKNLIFVDFDPLLGAMGFIPSNLDEVFSEYKLKNRKLAITTCQVMITSFFHNRYYSSRR